MHGRLWRGIFIGASSILLVVVFGCTEEITPSTFNHKKNPETFPHSHGQIQGKQTGTIRGRVRWHGATPYVSDFKAVSCTVFVPRWAHKDYMRTFNNPNRPNISKKTRGVKHAVVYLRKVPSAVFRPWPYKQATAVIENDSITIRQGKQRSSIGFVRPWQSVTHCHQRRSLSYFPSSWGRFFSPSRCHAGPMKYARER